MDHRASLILAASLLCGSAYAGYAQLSPPPGWSSGGGGGTFNFPAAANTATVAQSTVRTNAALNVGGRAVRVSAAMRLAANAPRIAALAIYAHPAVRVAAGVATWIGLTGYLYNATKGIWEQPDPDAPQSDGYGYQYPGRLIFSTPDAACRDYAGSIGGTGGEVRSDGLCYYVSKTGTNSATGGPRKVQSDCPAGWYVTPAGCVQTAPPKTITEEEFVKELEKHPMPDSVPLEVPSPFPVEVPEIQPMFIPTGNPVLNPKYDPSAAPSPENQPFLQPGVRVNPAPAPDAPWQVDLRPVNRPVASSEPSPNPEPLPTPGTDLGTDKPRDPETDERDFCDKHPDVLACQKLDEPEDPGKLKVQEVDFNFQPESGFAGSATCPSPITVSLSGRVFSISWQPFCNSLNMIRPFLLAMAWLSAAFIMLGARKE